MRNVYIQDADVYVPISQMSNVPISVGFDLNSMLYALPEVHNITKEMRQGKRQRKITTDPSNRMDSFLLPYLYIAKLLLTHGYCAPDNPWKKYGGWESPIFFENLNANINNQLFAERLLNFTEHQGASSFGVVRFYYHKS